MAFVIYSDEGEFLRDLEADMAEERVDDRLLRVSIKQRVEMPYIYLCVVASYTSGLEVIQLRRPLPNCMQGDAELWAKVRGDAEDLTEKLRREAHALGMTLRSGGHRAESEF